MAWGFFNKLKNGIVKVAKGIGKVLAPIAKNILPSAIETVGNAIKPGAGTAAKLGYETIYNTVDQIKHGGLKSNAVYNGNTMPGFDGRNSTKTNGLLGLARWQN